MEKLKTLKDIREEAHDSGTGLAYNDWWNESLKEEAIKWIKRCSNKINEEKDTCCYYHKGNLWIDDRTIEWIKHFFNITEKELK
jgi:hypothetical protein